MARTVGKREAVPGARARTVWPEPSRLDTLQRTIGNRAVRRALEGAGRPLDAAVQASFENSFGAPLGRVRVHADERAAKAARALGARAFTLGSSIWFGRGEYRPASTAGRRLLAHEVAHAVQQPAASGDVLVGAVNDVAERAAERAAERVMRGERAPLERVPGPAVIRRQPAPAPLDPDTAELATKAGRILFHMPVDFIDRKNKTEVENEAIAKQDVLMAFGDEAAVDAAFASLSPPVRADVERSGATTENHIQFFARMRLYFPSWAALLDHFRNIERVSDGPVDIFLYKDAAAAFRRAIAVLKAKGKPLPRVGGGFELRGSWHDAFFSPGYMVHALGFAFDVKAFTNPKISMTSQQGPGLERNDQTLLAVTVGPDRTRLALDQPGVGASDFIIKMGQRTAGDLTAAHDDTDPAAVAFFATFDQQFAQMVQGSQDFQNSLPAADRTKLLELRGEYFAELNALKAAPNAAARAPHQARRKEILAEIPGLLTGWIASIDKAIAQEQAKHPGMDKLRSPSVVAREQQTNAKELKTDTAAVTAADAEVARARTARDAAREALTRAQQAMARANQKANEPQPCVRRSGGDDWDVHGPCQPVQDPRPAAQAKLDAAQRAFDDRQADLEAAVLKRSDASTTVRAATATRDKLVGDLALSNAAAPATSWAWIDQLQDLRAALTQPHLDTPEGLEAYERLTTGNLSERTGDAPADNPPVLRMLDVGYFDPTGGFDRDFFEELTHSGFRPGASWSFGGVDAMHLQWEQGVRSILSPGKKPPKP